MGKHAAPEPDPIVVSGTWTEEEMQDHATQGGSK